MKREKMIQRGLAQRGPWDMVIIGGGATGVGIAVDDCNAGISSAGRPLRLALLSVVVAGIIAATYGCVKDG